MPTKPQHASAYRELPPLLKKMREEAGLTQRELGKRLKKPQQYVYTCETAIRRVDATEFILWARACDRDPKEAFAQLLKAMR